MSILGQRIDIQILTEWYTGAISASQSRLKSRKCTAGFYEEAKRRLKPSRTTDHDRKRNLRPQLQFLTLDCWQ